MNKNNDTVIDFKEIEKSYNQIRQKNYEAVLEWHWTKGFFSLEPYYAESNQFPKSRRIKKEPTQKFGHHKHGFDAKGRIVMELSYPFPFMETVFEETFFSYDIIPNCTVVSGFESKVKKTPNGEFRKLAYLEVYEYDKELLRRQHTIRPDFKTVSNFIYDETNKLTQKIHFDKKKEKHITNYSYNPKGELDQISVEDHAEFRKLTKPFAKIAIDAENALYKDVLKTILNQNVKEQVFSVFLSYSSTGFHLPPEMYICTTKDKLRLFDAESKAHIAENVLWQDVNEFQFGIYFGNETEHQEQYDLFLQVIQMKDQYSKLVDLINRVCKRLQEDKAKLGIDLSDDFIVMSSDYDLNDIKKNYTKIHGKK